MAQGRSIPSVDGEYVARMQDVLDLYAEAPDPERPLVASTRPPSSSSARCVSRFRLSRDSERYHYEYRRNGTVNLFCEPSTIVAGATSRLQTAAPP